MSTLWRIAFSEVRHNRSPARHALLQNGLDTSPSRGGTDSSPLVSGLSLVVWSTGCGGSGAWVSQGQVRGALRPLLPLSGALILGHGLPDPTLCRSIPRHPETWHWRSAPGFGRMACWWPDCPASPCDGPAPLSLQGLQPRLPSARETLKQEPWD